MAKKTNCPSITKKDTERLKKSLEQLNIETGKLTDAEIESAITKLMTEKDLTIDELLKPGYKTLIANAIGAARSQKSREDEVLNNTKIGNAEVSIGKEVKKSDPQKNRDILYIFTDNLQAYNTLAGSEDKVFNSSLLSPKEVTVNVGRTSALMRTDTAGEKNRNALGLVTKKNAQDKEGKWLSDSGNFEDTDEDYHSFIQANRRVIAKIKDALTKEGSEYKEVILPKTLAIENSGLPKRFAEALQNMLEKELGITTMILESKFGKDLYGLEVQPFGKQKKSRNQGKSKAEKLAQERQEALDSLNAQDPTLESDRVMYDKASRSLLSQVFPNIEERYARTSFIGTVFSQMLTDSVDYYRDYFNSMEDDNPKMDLRLKEGLNKGTVDQQRVFALENLRIDGRPLMEHIFHQMIVAMNNVISTSKELEKDSSPTSEAYKKAYAFMTNKNSSGSEFWIADEFMKEVEQHRSRGGKEYEEWTNDKFEAKVIQRFKHLALSFEQMLGTPGVFNALVKDMAFELEFNENIRISADSFDIERTAIEIEAEEENEEGSADNRSGLGLVKYKLMDPAKTLSIRMKTMLGKLYKMRGDEYIFNDLGQRVRLNPTLAYYILLDEFSKMNIPEDLDRTLTAVQQKYPWFGSLVDKLKSDRDLKNEFYTAFRKVFVEYGMITKDGFVKTLNKSNTSDTFLSEVLRHYEGRNVLSTDSIYNENGECNTRNVEKINTLCTKKSSKNSEVYEKHPFYWVRQVFSPKSKLHNIDNIFKALDILSGYSEDHKGISLEKLLNAVGIDTSNMLMDSLVPYIDRDDFEQFVKDNAHLGLSKLEMLESLFTQDQRTKIGNIIQAVINITKNEKGYQPGDHLIDKFQSSYLMIGSALTLASEAYTMASWRYGSQSRFSYASPDFISTFTGIISDTSDTEYGTEYILENYGRFDFFRNQETGEWYNTWLQMLLEEDSEYGDFEIRRNLKYINILGIGTNEDKDTIGRVDKKKFKEGTITAMFSANEDKHGRKYGYFRNPLFSDTDALVLMKMPRFSGPNFREDVINALAKTFRQELDRIMSFEDSETSSEVVEFYNDDRANGKKFMLFPEFNSMKDEIIAEVERLAEEDGGLFTEKRDNYIKSLLRGLLEQKVEKFLNGIEDADKAELYRRIIGLTKKSEDKNKNGQEVIDEIFDDDETNGETAEESEEVKSISEKQKEEIRDLLEEFYYNDYFGQSQFIQIIAGDLAYFKNYDDFVKRAKEAYACGDRMFALETDDNGDLVLDEKGRPKKLMETCIYAEDLDMVSNTWTSIKELLDADNSVFTPMERDILKGAVNAFTNICSTDGQSLRTLNSFRKIFKAMGGKWTDEMERAYKNLKDGNFDASSVISLINPIKPFLVSYETRRINGRLEKVGVQHKNSEYLISAAFSMINTALNKSPELQAYHEFMEEHDIDVLHFHSVVKHGFNNPFDINYDPNKFYKFLEKKRSENDGKYILYYKNEKGKDVESEITSFEGFKKTLLDMLKAGVIDQETYNANISQFRHTKESAKKALESQMMMTVESVSTDIDAMSPTYGQEFVVEEEVVNPNMFHHIPLEDMMIVQPTGDHLIGHDSKGEEAIKGSQLTNIMPADLPEGFKINIKINGENFKLDREATIELYNTLLTDNLLDSYEDLEGRFASINDLKRSLEAAMRGNPKYGDDIKAALEINASGTDFVMPTNSPNLTNKIEELILSAFKNAIQRQKIKGGNVVLVSNYGLSDSLHVKYNNDDASQGIEYIPAYMPAWMKDMYEDYIVEKTDGKYTYWTVDFEALKKNNEEDLFNIIGYRIPTEDKYSILPIRIVGFMPTFAGSTIMLPSDIITMSGTDFDIDKLFLMMRTTRREIFDKSLQKGFKKWLDNKAKKSETTSLAGNANLSEEFSALYDQTKEEAKTDETKIIEKILDEDRQGFTEEEINFFMRKSPSFRKYMNSKGSELELYRPIYRIERTSPITDEEGNLDIRATSKMEGIDSTKNRKNLRNNMFIDLVWNILTSPEGSKLSMQPGSFDNVKHASRMQRILHDTEALKKFDELYKDEVKTKGGLLNTLISKSFKELDNFYETYSSPASPMDIDDYVNKHQNLMDGNDLIGMFAVNSSNHYKFQFLDLKLNENNMFEIIIPGIAKPILLDAVDSVTAKETKVRIGRICAEFQAASPDNGKDPCLGDLGANIRTAFRIGFLARLGISPQIIGILNTADDLREAAAGWNVKIGDNEKFNGDMHKIVDLLFELRTTGTIKDSNDQKEAVLFAKYMDNIDSTARMLQEANSVSRVDSPNGALAVNTAEVVQQILKAEDFMMKAISPECQIKGLDQIVNIYLDASTMTKEELRESMLGAKIPRLQAAYTLGIKSAVSLSSSYLIQMNPTVLNAIRSLRDEMKVSLTRKQDTRTIRQFFSELTMFLLSENSIFASDTEGMSIMEKRNYYINNFPMKFKAFLDAKDEKGNYIHQDVRDLTFIQRLSNKHKKGISFENVGKVSPLSRKHYSEALESMLSSEDPETVKMAAALFMYSYYDNGLNFGHSNFGIFFTTSFMQHIPRFIENLRSANGKMVSDASVLRRFTQQFLLNHTNYIRGIKDTDVTFSMDEQSLVVHKDSLTKIYGGVDSTKSPIEFIRTSKGIFRVSSDTSLTSIGRSTGILYTRVGSNRLKGKDFTPFYDANLDVQQIAWEDLKGRGVIVSQKDLEKFEEAEKKKAAKEKKSEEDSIDNPNVKDEDVDVNTSNMPSDNTGEPELSVPKDLDTGDDGSANIDPDALTGIPEDNDVEPENIESLARQANEAEEIAREKESKSLEELEGISDPENKLCINKK